MDKLIGSIPWFCLLIAVTLVQTSGCLLILPLDEVSEEDEEDPGTSATQECRTFPLPRPYIMDEQLLVAYCALARMNTGFRCSRSEPNFTMCSHDNPTLTYTVTWESERKGDMTSADGKHFAWLYPNREFPGGAVHWVIYTDGMEGPCLPDLGNDPYEDVSMCWLQPSSP